MTDHATLADSHSSSSARDMGAAFAERLGRPLNEAETAFVEHLFADSSIAAPRGDTPRLRDALSRVARASATT